MFIGARHLNDVIKYIMIFGIINKISDMENDRIFISFAARANNIYDRITKVPYTT
jgi:hypothetical protein